jgi:hypothetical protein
MVGAGLSRPVGASVEGFYPEFVSSWVPCCFPFILLPLLFNSSCVSALQWVVFSFPLIFSGILYMSTLLVQ